MQPGDSVKILPHADLFMMGERFATIVKIGRLWIHVRGHRSGKVFKFHIQTDALERV
jgi:hypothetical protein